MSEGRIYQASIYVTAEMMRAAAIDMVAYTEREVRRKLEEHGLPGGLVALARVEWCVRRGRHCERWNPKLEAIPDGARSFLCRAEVKTTGGTTDG